MHRVTAVSGNQKQERDAPVSDGHTETIVFKFQTATAAATQQIPPEQIISSPPPPGLRAMRNATWVSFGVGGAALAFSGTTAIWAAVKMHDLDKLGSWDVNRCEIAPSQSDCNAYRQLRNWSLVGFYTGLVGVTTGTVLFLATPSKPTRHPSAAQLTPWVGLGSAGVQGRF
jgi:hypothetical protein